MQTRLQVSEILLTFAVAYKYRDLRVNVSEGWVQEQRQTCFLNLLLCPDLEKEGSRGDCGHHGHLKYTNFLFTYVYIYLYSFLFF